MTKSEKRLWHALRTLRAKGFRFRRQHPYEPFYLDFVCLDRRLVVEVDGPHHDSPPQLARDAARDALLARDGFEVLRISSALAFYNTGDALRLVETALVRRTPVWLGRKKPEGARRRNGSPP